MTQSPRMSAAEAASNVMIGWLVALVTQLTLFPLLGLPASAGQHVTLSIVFTAVSFARSYVLRRFFARYG